jgi:hypothetical protein
MQRAQELGLDAGGNLADLVEEDGAAPGDLEEAGLVPHGAGERAAHVAEQLRLEQRLGERGAVDADERRRRAGTLIVDHPDDELLAGAALAVDEHRRVERRDPGRQLEHLLHRGAARHELPRRRVPRDSRAQQIELALAPLEQPLPAIQLPQPLLHRGAQPLDLVPEVRRLEVGADAVDLGAPARRVAADGRAVLRTLAGAAHLAEVDFTSETGTGKTARVADE